MISRRGFFAFLSGIGGAAAFARSLLAAAPPPTSAASLPEAAGFDVLHVAGRVRWYDPSEGYGFVTSDGGGEDILLHVTCLRAAGYQTAKEGARVECQVLRRPKGLQVFRILSMDESSAPDGSPPQRRHTEVEPESEWERANVKWFNRVRGYGFLTRGDGTDDIFAHLETVQRFGMSELMPGQTVWVRWGMGAKGTTAAQLRPG